MQKIENEIKKSIYKFFSKYLSYAFLTGSYVVGNVTKGKSDIDFCIVFNEKIRDKSNKELIDKMNHFILDYLRIHKSHNLTPDFLYPGVEIFTLAQIEDMLRGRGFNIRKEKIHFNKLKDEDFFNDMDIWYRAWLGMHSWSKYLIGDKPLFLKNRKKCCKTILKLFLLNLPKELKQTNFYEKISRKRKIWESFGVKEEEISIIIKKYLSPHFKDFILWNTGDIKKRRFITDKKELLNWEREVVERLENGKFYSSLIFSFKELKQFSVLAKRLYNRRFAK